MSEYDSVVTPIMRWLNAIPGCKVINIHGGIYTERGTPDIIGSYFGRVVVFEAKDTGGVPSRQQEIRIEQWKRAGAIAAIVWSLEDAVDAIEEQYTEENIGRKRWED